MLENEQNCQTDALELTGEVQTWKVGGTSRTFSTLTLPFCKMKKFIKRVLFNGLTGEGQQRDIINGHSRTLKKAMEGGTYTPTPFSASLSSEHMKFLKCEGNRFSLTVGSSAPLLLTDGGHRLDALSDIVEELQSKVQTSQDETEKRTYQEALENVLHAPIAFTLYLDGDAQTDFANLQKGRPVDSAHMLSLKKKQSGDPALNLAFETARVLQKDKNGPFPGHIRFDSRGSQSLPISTLCSTGKSDLGTSLVGLAQIALAGEMPLTAPQLASVVVKAYEAISNHDEFILEQGKVLATIGNSGKRGQATMMIGVAVCLASRMQAQGHAEPTEEDLKRLVEAVAKTLDVYVAKNFSGPVKRQLLGRFAEVFLGDLPGERHDGLPLVLLKTLSPSTFGAEPLPKEPKPRGRSRGQSLLRVAE